MKHSKMLGHRKNCMHISIPIFVVFQLLSHVQLFATPLTLAHLDFLSSCCLLSHFKSCPTLCDPIDGSRPGSPIPGILQARTLEWVAISFSNAWKQKVKMKLLSCVWLSNPMDCRLPGSPAHGIFQARVLEWVAIAFSVLSSAISQSLFKLMSIESVMLSNHLILHCPLLLLLSIFPTIATSQWVSSSHQVAKILALQLQHQSFQWIFKVDFL